MKKMGVARVTIYLFALYFFSLFSTHAAAHTRLNHDELENLQRTVVQVKAFYVNKETPPKRTGRNGSGVFVSKDGLVLAIITNEHVVIRDGENDTYKLEKIIVITLNGALVEGTILWQDKELDLAIIKTPLAETPYAHISREKLFLGDDIVIIGHPFISFPWHISFSRIGFLNRNIGISTSLIEVDGHINPGNSGGGVFNSRGKLIGTPKSAVSSQTEFFSQTGIGLFIPIEYFCIAQPSYCPQP